MYTKIEGARSCTETDMGFYSGDSVVDQTACPIGTYASTRAQSECDDCSPGFYTQSEQSEACTPRDAGTFASEPGSLVCEPCPSDYFKPQSECNCVHHVQQVRTVQRDANTGVVAAHREIDVPPVKSDLTVKMVLK